MNAKTMTRNELCSTHRDTPEVGRCSTCKRMRDERKVARKAIRELLGAGFLLSVNDGEETTVSNSDDAVVLFDAMFTTDEDILIARDPAGQRKGSVLFIWGNSGSDCINDYSTALEPALVQTFALMDSMA